MLNIRLSRTGKNRQPSFRVVVQEHTAAVKGKFIEAIGHYYPATRSKEFKVDLERIKHWLSVGAQPSDTMAVLLKREGVEGMDRYIAPRDKKRKNKSEKEASPQAAQAAPSAQAPAKESEPAAKSEPESMPAEAPAVAETPAETAAAPEPVKESEPAPAAPTPAQS